MKFIYFLADKYRLMTSEKYQTMKETPMDAPSVETTNPFDNLDCKKGYLLLERFPL